MKRKIIAFISVFAMLLLLVIPAHAAPNTARGPIIRVGTGLRAVVSTMVGTGSPPAFFFTNKSPDVYQAFFSSQIHPVNGCLQAEVLHEHLVGFGTTHKFQVYNWCSPGVGTSYSISLLDSTFRGKYVRTNTWNDTGTAFQDENIDVRVYNTTGTTWVAQIYNYNTSTYDTLVTKSGTSINNEGSANFGDAGYTQDSPGAYCPTLYPWGVMQIRGIQKLVSGTWSFITAGDIYAYYTDSMYCFSSSQYMSTTPQPYQFKVLPFGVAY